jgi:DNA-binding transcriptional MerR regulator
MPGIRTNAAAEVLGVSPNTLRSWERRYGYPTPKRTVGNHRNYELMELQTLRDALADTGNISSAIELARQRQAAPASNDSLLVAFESFDEGAADQAIEESLALRPLERTVEELLLPAIAGRAGIRLALGNRLAARCPPPRRGRLTPGRNPAA